MKSKQFVVTYVIQRIGILMLSLMMMTMYMHFTLYHEFRLGVPRAIHHELLIKHSCALEQDTRRIVSRALKRWYSCPLFRVIVSTLSHTHHSFLYKVQVLYRGLKFDQNRKPMDFLKLSYAFTFKSPPTKYLHYSVITHINDSVIKLIYSF